MFAKSTAEPRTLVIAACQRGLAVVDVTDGADVDVRLSALELFLRHFSNNLCLKIWDFCGGGNGARGIRRRP